MAEITNVELPDSIRRTLPKDAQEVYQQAYEASWNSYSPGVQRTLDRGAIAHRDAWGAVLREFEQDTETGHWHRRGEAPAARHEEHSSLWDKIKGIFAG